MTGYYERMAAFVSRYVKCTNGDPIPPEPYWIRAAIANMLQDGVYEDAEALRRDALATWDVVIPDAFFPEED